MHVVKLNTLQEEPRARLPDCRMDRRIGDTDTADHHP
jgi:hypothetical protein